MKRFRPLPAATIGLIGLATVALFGLPKVGQATIRSIGSFDDTQTSVDTVCLSYLPDAGALAVVHASVPLTGGGTLDNYKAFELTGSSQTTALNALSAGKTGWNNRNGQ